MWRHEKHWCTKTNKQGPSSSNEVLISPGYTQELSGASDSDVNSDRPQLVEPPALCNRERLPRSPLCFHLSWHVQGDEYMAPARSSEEQRRRRAPRPETTGLAQRTWLLGALQNVRYQRYREACSMCFGVLSGNHDRWLDWTQAKSGHMQVGVWIKDKKNWVCQTRTFRAQDQMEKDQEKRLNTWRQKKRWGRNWRTQKRGNAGERTRAALSSFIPHCPQASQASYQLCNCIHLTQHISIKHPMGRPHALHTMCTHALEAAWPCYTHLLILHPSVWKLEGENSAEVTSALLPGACE